MFDADKVAGNALRVHRAAGGETLEALDDKTYTMSEGMTVISDANGVESLGGIMGGIIRDVRMRQSMYFLKGPFLIRSAPPIPAVTPRSIQTRATDLNGGLTLWTPKGLMRQPR